MKFEIVKDILEEYKRLKEIAFLNRSNSINNNAERTRQDIKDFENKKIEDLLTKEKKNIQEVKK